MRVDYKEKWRSRIWFAIHNLVAHPLLVLHPPSGEWLHVFTARRMAQGREVADGE